MQPLPRARRRGVFLGTALLSASLILSAGLAVAAPTPGTGTSPVEAVSEQLDEAQGGVTSWVVHQDGPHDTGIA